MHFREYLLVPKDKNEREIVFDTVIIRWFFMMVKTLVSLKILDIEKWGAMDPLPPPLIAGHEMRPYLVIYFLN